MWWAAAQGGAGKGAQGAPARRGKQGQGQAQEGPAEFSWLLQNITAYGPAVLRFLGEYPEYKGACLPEAHVPLVNEGRLFEQLLKEGWYSDLAPSQLTEKGAPPAVADLRNQEGV